MRFYKSNTSNSFKMSKNSKINCHLKSIMVVSTTLTCNVRAAPLEEKGEGKEAEEEGRRQPQPLSGRHPAVRLT